MDAATEKLKEVGESIAQDVQDLLEPADRVGLVPLSNGSTVQMDPTEVESL